ncbi:hypothetical protein MTR_2g066990 [Medicago truncatula]|uniref:Uncharacterized protein n=1 Tax=Medicago truncatula TaxID=3880 RepID=G8A0A2_MEDTR|nr:hypothetical protein MTR_2g066990 [Medicago truncatula]
MAKVWRSQEAELKKFAISEYFANSENVPRSFRHQRNLAKIQDFQVDKGMRKKLDEKWSENEWKRKSQINGENRKSSDAPLHAHWRVDSNN